MAIHENKRVRLDAQDAPPSQKHAPRLFAPFRVLGLMTNHVPFSVIVHSTRGSSVAPRIVIATCLGNSWAMWEGGKMTLLFVGPDLEEPISSIHVTGDAVWAASGSRVFKFRRGKHEDELSSPLASRLSTILLFGSRMLALTEDGRHLIVWDIESTMVANTIEFDEGFTASCFMHPATYVNKILVGGTEGALQLWNIATSSCLYRFEPSSLRPLSSKPALSAITALAQSPAVDVVGIGFASGEVVIYDIRADERLLAVNMGVGVNSSGGDLGGISAIGFRSDGEPILATASSSGHIAFWDLNTNASLLHITRGAHDGSVTALEWIPGQPLLLTSGDDNSVKQWLFDSPTAPPRLLKFRGGHQMPPHLIRYYGTDGKQLLTASRDRSLRYLSVVRDSRSFEMSQGSLLKKSNSLSMPLSHFKFSSITSISFSCARSKDWEDVLTAHSSHSVQNVSGSSSSGSSFARTWSVQNKRLGRWAMGLDAVDSRGIFPENSSKGQRRNKNRSAAASVVRSILVTPCGNFGLAGSGDREITMWNMQSGIRRRTFNVGPFKEANTTVKSSIQENTVAGKEPNKERAITGLAVDALNTVLVAATLDGTLNFFDFHTTKLEHVIHIPSAISSLSFQSDSGLIALICDDSTVRLIDLQTQRVVRELRGFRARLLDMTFSHDSRWLVTTSLDSVIRTFDIPTGKLIDAFKTPSIATSVSFSPTGDFLATAHVDSVGVYLWANRAQYTEVSFHSFIEDPSAGCSNVPVVSLPSMQGTAEEEALDILGALTLEDNPASVYTTPDQLGEGLVTLTLLPRSKWQTLLNLEVIHKRNKPTEPPKVPERAPFFLPTLPGVEHRFITDTEAPNKNEAITGRNLALERGAVIESEFVSRLAEAHEGSGESFFTYVKMLSPAALDLEVRMLSMNPRSSSQSTILLFINVLTKRLESHRDFELVQSLMVIFIRFHGDSIVRSYAMSPGGTSSEADEVQTTLERLGEVQKRESERVLGLIGSAMGILGFVREFR